MGQNAKKKYTQPKKKRKNKTNKKPTWNDNDKNALTYQSEQKLTENKKR